MAEGVDDLHFVVALIENRAKEVGMAAFDLRTASLHLNQYIETSRSYQNTLTLLQYFDPTELITCASNADGVASLIEHSSLTNARKTAVQRGCFDDTKGALLVRSFAVTSENCSANLDSYQKQYYLALGAASAALKWVECEKGILITSHSLKVTYNGSYDHMNIDSTSVQNLEIISPLWSTPSTTSAKAKKGSLYGILNNTKTVCGSRLLKANLLQPLKDIETLNTRLDCLDNITDDENLFFSLQQVMSKIPKDIDRVFSQFAYKLKKQMNMDSSGATTMRRNQQLVAGIILLKEALTLVPSLAEVLSRAQSSLLENIRDSVCLHPKVKELRDSIDEIIDEDVLHARQAFVARTQQCFAVKAGVDGFLDVARKSFCETTEDMHELAKRYRDEYNLPNLKLPYNGKQGFYISIPAKDIENEPLPRIFIQVSKHGKNVFCSTQELVALNVRNKEAAAECYLRTERALEGLCQTIRENIQLLMLLSESVAMLDMMVNSFAHIISTSAPDTYHRPEFTEDGPIAIDAGRHPIVENLHSDTPFVANSTFLSEASNMMIVTGPNMSGKSTYLKQVSLIAVMAHIGCYVPARYASFRVVDKLFTRIGTGDNLENNSSTFMTEMRETAFLMQNMTSRSLILIDELGRATSSTDGLAIAWACSEALLATKGYVIFATHMSRLAELSSIYPNVKVCYLSVAIENDRLSFLYNLREGYTDVPHYGVLLAEIAGMPPEVIQDARKIAQKLDDQETKRLDSGYSAYLNLRKDYYVAQRLLCLKYANLEKEHMRDYLQNLKNQYLDGQIG